MPTYPQEQLQELYKALPQNLQQALFSQQTADNIDEICRDNKISDKDVIFDVAKNTGYVLLGLLQPDGLSKVLEYELKLKSETAEKISNEISRFVFMPLRETLEQLYQTKLKMQRVKKDTSPEIKTKPKSKDSYRELIE